MRLRMTRPVFAMAAAALMMAAITGASSAQQNSGLEEATVQELGDLNALGPIMLRVKGAPAARAYADAKAGGASNAQAANAGRAQDAQNENAQRGVLNALERVSSVSVLYRVQSAYNGIAVQAPRGLMSELAELPNVEEVLPIPLHTPHHASSVNLIGGPAAWGNFGKTGAGLKIGIIDSGTDWVHTNFGGRGTASDYTTARAAANNPPMLSTQKDTSAFTIVAGDGTKIYPSAKVAGGIDLVGDSYNGTNTAVRDPNPLDCATGVGNAAGHGSHVSGSAAGYGTNADGTTYTGPYDATTPLDSLGIGPGVAPEATLYSIRVFGCSGSTAFTVAAIDWATDPNGDGNLADRMDVINMSLGSAYGTPIDPSATASNNAATAGIIVVASAGNSGDAYYVTGSPASASRAISVASSADDVDVADAFRVNSPASIAGLYGASRSVSFNWFNPPATSPIPLTADLYYPATNQYGCSRWTDANDLTNIAGKIVLVDWKKPGDATFPCGSALRANNARDDGAKGVIMVDTTPYLDTSIGGNAQIPAMYSTSHVGDALKSELTPGVPSGVSITFSTEWFNKGKVVSPGRADTISTFTSRGVRGPDNGHKPDIAAPGQGIHSANSGAGSQGRTISGTSMASPHMAGVMALLKQANPTWTVEHLKALAMNTADTDLYTGFNHTGDKYGSGRVGSGRVDVANALASEAVAYADDGSGSVGVSFGALEVVSSLTQQRTIRVSNHGSSAETFSVAFDPRVTIPGVSYSLPDGNSLTVPAGGSATLTVQIDADAAAMKHTRDTTVAATQTSGTVTFPRQWISEASGLVLLTPASGPDLRVPVYATARPASNTEATTSSIRLFGDTATSSSITLRGAGVNTGPSEPLDLFSRVTAFELAAQSGLASLPSTFPAHTRHADISHVGVSSDVKARLAAGQPAANSWIFFGLASHANWATAATEQAFTIQIDTNGDNVVDYNVFNTRLVAPPNNDPLDIYVGARTRLAPPATPPSQTLATDFTNGRAVESTALFNNNVLVIPVSAALLGYTTSSTSTTFRYRVLGSSRFWGLVDAVPSTTGWLTYNFAAPGLDFTGGTLGIPQYPDQGDQVIPVGYDSAAYTANASQGALLLHHFGVTGSRAEVLTLQTSPGPPPRRDRP